MSVNEIVKWEASFELGIELIDSQHKELVGHINNLYRACLVGTEVADTQFKETMSRLVGYVRLHFAAEQELLTRVKFPDFKDHKKQHDSLVVNILTAAKDFNEGKKFVPHRFVRSLKDWVLSHIAVYDKVYAAYIHEQLSKGLLTEKQISGQ